MNFQKKGHTLVKDILSPEEIAVYRPVIVDAAERYNTEKRKMAGQGHLWQSLFADHESVARLTKK